jgi:hypothetical protein
MQSQQSATDQNKGTAWLDNNAEVSADLNGMIDFFNQLVTISLNAATDHLQLTGLAQYPSQAWAKSSFGEASYAMQQMIGNQTEFDEYVRNYNVSLINIGGAAKTISYLYGGWDGWSAANLDAITFAFGDKNSPAASDWPFSDPPTTYADQIATSQQNQDTTGGQNIWQPHGDPVKHDGLVVLTFWNQFPEGDPRHKVKTVTTLTEPGQTTTTTVVDGKTTSTLEKTAPDGTKTTITTDGSGAVLNTEVITTTTANGVTTTTTTEDDGKTQTATIVQSTSSGQTITSEDYENGNWVVKNTLYVGTETDGPSSEGQQAYLNAVREVQNRGY